MTIPFTDYYPAPPSPKSADYLPWAYGLHAARMARVGLPGITPGAIAAPVVHVCHGPAAGGSGREGDPYTAPDTAALFALFDDIAASRRSIAFWDGSLFEHTHVGGSTVNVEAVDLGITRYRNPDYLRANAARAGLHGNLDGRPCVTGFGTLAGSAIATTGWTKTPGYSRVWQITLTAKPHWVCDRGQPVHRWHEAVDHQDPQVFGDGVTPTHQMTLSEALTLLDQKAAGDAVSFTGGRAWHWRTDTLYVSFPADPDQSGRDRFTLDAGVGRSDAEVLADTCATVRDHKGWAFDCDRLAMRGLLMTGIGMDPATSPYIITIGNSNNVGGEVVLSDLWLYGARNHTHGAAQTAAAYTTSDVQSGNVLRGHLNSPVTNNITHAQAGGNEGVNLRHGRSLAWLLGNAPPECGEPPTHGQPAWRGRRTYAHTGGGAAKVGLFLDIDGYSPGAADGLPYGLRDGFNAADTPAFDVDTSPEDCRVACIGEVYQGSGDANGGVGLNNFADNFSRINCRVHGAFPDMLANQSVTSVAQSGFVLNCEIIRDFSASVNNFPYEWAALGAAQKLDMEGTRIVGITRAGQTYRLARANPDDATNGVATNSIDVRGCVFIHEGDGTFRVNLLPANQINCAYLDTLASDRSGATNPVTLTEDPGVGVPADGSVLFDAGAGDLEYDRHGRPRGDDAPATRSIGTVEAEPARTGQPLRTATMPDVFDPVTTRATTSAGDTSRLAAIDGTRTTRAAIATALGLVDEAAVPRATLQQKPRQRTANAADLDIWGDGDAGDVINWWAYGHDAAGTLRLLAHGEATLGAFAAELPVPGESTPVTRRAAESITFNADPALAAAEAEAGAAGAAGVTNDTGGIARVRLAVLPPVTEIYTDTRPKVAGGPDDALGVITPRVR